MFGTTQSNLPNQNPVALFEDQEAAEAARQALQAAGFAAEQVSLVPRSLDPNPPVRDTEARKSAGGGAIVGSLFGAIAGFLVGYISLILPRTPIIDIGNVVGLVLAGSGVGAAMGGLIAMVTGTYVHKGEVEPQYAQMKQQFLIFVDGDADAQRRAREIMQT